MIPQSVDGPSPILLGPEDLAVFDRLRAIALLFHAARAAIPELDAIKLGFWANRQIQISPIRTISPQSCLFLARAAGWDDLARAATGTIKPFDIWTPIHERTRVAEFPTGCPAGIARLLERIRTHPPVADTVALVARAGWRLNHPRAELYPVLSEPVSAHELLDALTAAAEHRLGSGPLAALARAARAALINRLP